MSATTNLGKVSVTPKGAWANTNTYEILDIVTSGGSSYLAKQDVPTGVPLSNTSYWIMIAEKGDGGEVTSASASISGGYGTPGVSVTAGGTAHERTLAFAFTNLRGEKGETGNGIDSVYKTGTSGLVDTYTILFTDGSTYEFEVNNGTASIDDTLTKSGWAADAKAVGDTKASIDGFYETMGVGVADNLTPYSEDSGATQDIPFIAQGTGCGNGESVVDTGSYFQFKKKLGNTVCVNQLVPVNAIPNKTSAGITLTSNNDGTYTINGTATSTFTSTSYTPGIPSGHKVLVQGSQVQVLEGSTSLYGDVSTGVIVDSGGDLKIRFRVASGTTLSSLKSRPIVRDLTLWFGSNDRIPSDLLSHPENWGRYYAGSLDYNAGTLENADGTVLKSLPRNIFNKATSTTGKRFGGSGTQLIDRASGSVTDYIPTIPNAQYYARKVSGSGIGNTFVFYDGNKDYIGEYSLYGSTGLSGTVTVPSNCRFIRFQYETADADDVTFSLYYSGESGYDESYPFSVLAEVDTGSEVLRSAGKYCDEKDPDGTITRIITSGDLGDLNWAYDNIGFFWANITNLGIIKILSTDDLTSHPISCAAYATTTLQTNAIDNNWASEPNKTIGYHCAGSSGSPIYLYIKDTSYGSDAAAFKTGVTGTKWQYAEATPTTEQGTAFAENIPCDDFGSMYWTQTKGIPQGNEIFYPVDYKASIDTLYNRVEGDMSAIVIDGQLEVVADRIPEAPSEDGTYTLKATVSSGTKTYSWVADE